MEKNTTNPNTTEPDSGEYIDEIMARAGMAEEDIPFTHTEPPREHTGVVPLIFGLGVAIAVCAFMSVCNAIYRHFKSRRDRRREARAIRRANLYNQSRTSGSPVPSVETNTSVKQVSPSTSSSRTAPESAHTSASTSQLEGTSSEIAQQRESVESSLPDNSSELVVDSRTTSVEMVSLEDETFDSSSPLPDDMTRRKSSSSDSTEETEV